MRREGFRRKFLTSCRIGCSVPRGVRSPRGEPRSGASFLVGAKSSWVPRHISLLYASNETGRHTDSAGALGVKVKLMPLCICSLVARQASPRERLCCFIYFISTLPSKVKTFVAGPHLQKHESGSSVWRKGYKGLSRQSYHRLCPPHPEMVTSVLGTRTTGSVW